jgi:hypothetical protein
LNSVFLEEKIQKISHFYERFSPKVEKDNLYNNVPAYENLEFDAIFYSKFEANFNSEFDKAVVTVYKLLLQFIPKVEKDNLYDNIATYEDLDFAQSSIWT